MSAILARPIAWPRTLALMIRAPSRLRPGLEQWLTERAAWPGADTSPAFFLNTANNSELL